MVELTADSKFKTEKTKALSRQDASKKGIIDAEILPLIKLLNSLPGYYTTSSCAGRIVLLKIPENGRKNQAEWLYATHQQADFAKIKRILDKLKEKPVKEDVWLKQEPAIIHIAAKNIKAAEKMLEKTRQAGLKRSGIITAGKRIILEIIGTEKLETIVVKNKKVLVNEEYLKVLVDEANKKLMNTREKLDKFFKLLAR